MGQLEQEIGSGNRLEADHDLLPGGFVGIGLVAEGSDHIIY